MLEMGISFVALFCLELILGIDNVVLVTVVTGKLPLSQRASARRWGIGLALVGRLVLLSCLWLLSTAEGVYWDLFGFHVTLTGAVFTLGGVFLLLKAVHEIYEAVEGEGNVDHAVQPHFRGFPVLWSVFAQIVLFDLVFSLDSVLMAVGLSGELPVMIAAVVSSMVCMMLCAGIIGRVIDAHPSLKILSLSFLVLIAVMLIADGTGYHVPKGYIYVAMGFAVIVEMLKIRLSSRRKRLNERAPGKKGDIRNTTTRTETTNRRKTMTTILEALKYAGETIHGGNPQDAKIAQDWKDNGFASGEDCEPWWEAGCFDAHSAAELRDAGIAASDVSITHDAISIGYWHSNGDMGLDDVRKVLADN